MTELDYRIDLPRTSRGTWSLARLFRHGLTVLAVRRQRKELALLDESQLHDLGIDRPTALAEARRKLWDVPHHWRV